ncbi:elongation factor 1-delta isoform X1 [Pelobates cultripes]|nr:elongation factor 1-delta isoform X1 [Pelobates cultripes]
MRTRKHQSPVESAWVETNEDTSRATCELQPGDTTPSKEASNGCNQYDSGENSSNVDQKKTNGKKQKRRKRSPRNKGLLPKVDCMLSGLMADKVWFDKYLYEEAEYAYHAMLAKELHTKPSDPESARQDSPSPALRNCSHSSQSACHHVDNGIWINKFSFDDAERQFVLQFVSPLAPRPLVLSLESHKTDVTEVMHRASDEGYVSATPTPAAPDLQVFGAPATPTGTTVNGKPQWAGLQDLLSDVWLEKPSFDQAEKIFYENIASKQSALKTNSNQYWSFHSGKKNKRDKWNRKSAGKQPQQTSKKRDLASIPEESSGLLQNPVYYFLHQDSECVWLNKPAYDQAEERFYVAQSLNIQQAVNAKKPTVAKVQKVAKKCRRRAVLPHKKTMATSCLTTEKIWFDRFKYEDAERQYYENLSKNLAENSPNSPNTPNQQQEDGSSTILRDIARARENIQKSLSGLRDVLHSPKEASPSLPQSQSGSHTSTAAAPASGGDNSELLSRVSTLEHENQNLHKVVKDLLLAISALESRVDTLEKSATSDQPRPAPFVCKLPAPEEVKVAPVAEAPKKKEEDDDDIDLFGSDEEEDAEAVKVKEERLRQYAEKKSKKPGIIAKSSILLDVKPWDDETDMAKLEECVRSVQMDGLLWGSSKLVPVGYGIKKLQIQCVVEDDKVGTDILEEEITKFEDYVQSVDIAAFNKI